MQQQVLAIAAIIAGMALPLQAAMNSRLGYAVQNPVVAAFWSFLSGTVLLFLYLLFTKWRPSQMQPWTQPPHYVWFGGLLGAFYVSLIVVFVPRLGVALTFSLVIFGQMLLSVVMDNFGWMGLQVHSVSAGRIIGILLLIAGVIMVRRY